MNEITIGVDEVGRGCIMGPMCVAAVADLTGWRLAGIRDSKKIKSEHTRQVLANEIRHNLPWITIMVDSVAIDRFGIAACLLNAGKQVGQRLAERLRKAGLTAPISIIYDGNDHSDRLLPELNATVKSIVRADDSVFEVSAASILAKVTRDNWIHKLVDIDPKYAVYDLHQNKGYGTPRHMLGLKKAGMSPLHRRVATRTFMGCEPARNDYVTHPITTTEEASGAAGVGPGTVRRAS